MLGQLSRVQWLLGQTLLPEHFEAQEMSLFTENSVKFALQGQPFYGVVQITLNLTELLKNIVGIDAFSYVTETGEYIHLNENAVLGSPYVVLPSQSGQVALWIDVEQKHQVDQERPQGLLRPEIIPTEKTAIPRCYYQLRLRAVSDEAANGDQLVPQKGEVAFSRQSRVVASVKLGCFTQSADQYWMLDESYLPPMIVLNRSPLFKKRCATLIRHLECLRGELEGLFARHVQPPQVVGGHHVTEDGRACDGLQRPSSEGRKNINGGAGSDLMLMLSCSHDTLRLLTTIQQAGSEIIVHPYVLFAQLQTLCDLCHLYRQELPPRTPLRYEHRNLAVVFDSMIEQLDRLVWLRELEIQRIPMKEVDGIYSCRLDITSGSVDCAYYLAIYRDGSLPLCSPPEKISTVERVRKLFEYSFDGVQLREVKEGGAIARLKRATTPAHGAQYYEIQRDGEWEKVEEEGTLAFYGQSAYRQYQFECLVEKIHYAARA